MTKRINTFWAIALFTAIALNITPLQANAAIFDWLLGQKVIEFQPKFSAFAGVGRDSGINLLNDDEGSSVTQFVQSIAVFATNDPSVITKTRKTENRVYTVPATAYSSTPDQTDSTPFITATGTHVRDGVIAANFLPMGTVVKIPELYGNKTFVVEDRMNSRYFYQIDIWFPTRAEAKEFGVKKIKIEIIS